MSPRVGRRGGFRTGVGYVKKNFLAGQEFIDFSAVQPAAPAVGGVAEVALACGFASQQHLTNAMRHHAGVTPARYRCTAASGPDSAHRIDERAESG